MQVIQKLPENGYENGIKENAMFEYRLQREDYWMKTFPTVYPYGLNVGIRFMNKDSPRGKLFIPRPRYGDCFIDTRTRSRSTNRGLSSDIEIFLNFLKQFSLKYRTNKCQSYLKALRKEN